MTDSITTKILTEFQIKQSDIFTIQSNNRTIVTLTSQGELVYGEGYTPDEAARVFWEALRSYAPLCARCQQRAGRR